MVKKLFRSIRSSAWTPQRVAFEELTRGDATALARDRIKLNVTRPAGWLWWPGSIPLIDSDPDQMGERRRPSIISGLDVDWYRILHAVRYAVAHLPSDVDTLLTLEEFEVEIPFTLGVEERRLAQSWLGHDTPVTFWPEELRIDDGRHRLWLTRQHYASCDVPMFDYHFFFVRDLSAELSLAALSNELSWWEEQCKELRRTAATHCAVLRQLSPSLARHSWLR